MISLPSFPFASPRPQFLSATSSDHRLPQKHDNLTLTSQLLKTLRTTFRSQMMFRRDHIRDDEVDQFRFQTSEMRFSQSRWDSGCGRRCKIRRKWGGVYVDPNVLRRK